MPKTEKSYICPMCGGDSYIHDRDFFNPSMNLSRNVYYCGGCYLYYGKPRGGKKKRSYINLNDRQSMDLVDELDYESQMKWGFNVYDETGEYDEYDD